MIVLIKSLESQVAKAISKQSVKPMMMRTLGPKSPQRNMKPMLKLDMLSCKPSMMAYHGLSIAFLLMIFDKI